MKHEDENTQTVEVKKQNHPFLIYVLRIKMEEKKLPLPCTFSVAKQL